MSLAATTSSISDGSRHMQKVSSVTAAPQTSQEPVKVKKNVSQQRVTLDNARRWASEVVTAWSVRGVDFDWFSAKDKYMFVGAGYSITDDVMNAWRAYANDTGYTEWKKKKEDAGWMKHYPFLAPLPYAAPDSGKLYWGHAVPDSVSERSFSQLPRCGKEKQEALPEQMMKLVRLRSTFLCAVIFRVSENANCLHEGTRALDVPIPPEINLFQAWSQESTDHHVRAFTPAQQKCTASAQGSVTSLSDLDFTVSCFGRSDVPDDTAKQQAMDEVDIAEALTDAILYIVGKTPGILFDTNFYTNTFKYSSAFGQSCTSNPIPGLAMGLYAAARGLFAIDHYSKNYAVCTGKITTGASGEIITTLDLAHVSGTTIGEIFGGLATRTDTDKFEGKFLHETSSEMVNLYGRVVHEAGITDFDEHFQHNVTSFGVASFRTQTYFQLLRYAMTPSNREEIEKDKNIPPEYDNFCMEVAHALIFANEAYWNNGAIKQVLERNPQMSIRGSIESALMNLGYALEHLVHELMRGDNTVGASTGACRDDVMMCNYGDGLIKMGKYGERIRGALTASGIYDANRRPYNLGVVQQFFRYSYTFLKAKEFGKNQEEGGNAEGLPDAYILAYTNLLGGRKHRCRLLNLVATAASEIIDDLFARYE